MRNNHPTITYAYHFLSEAIIIFLIALTFIHHRLFWGNYWSYLAIIIETCIVFTILTRLTKNYFWYILMVPALFGVFYVLDFPLFFSILCSVSLVWRYIDIRKEDVISRENNYILFTFLLTAVNSLLVNDKLIMLYPLLLFLILIVGYIGSHLAVVQRNERKQFDIKLPFYFIALLALGAGIFFYIFNVTRAAIITIWQGFLNLIGSAIAGVASLFSFIEVEEREWPEQLSEGEAFKDDGHWNEPEGTSLIEVITPYILIGIIIFVISLAIIIAVKLSKKRFNSRMKGVESSKTVSYSEMEDKPKRKSIKNDLKGFYKRPDHPVRKMVYQFEKAAARNNKGRKTFETIEDWLKRIGIKGDFTVYQRVRYGEVAAISEKEKDELKRQLKQMEENFSDS